MTTPATPRLRSGLNLARTASSLILFFLSLNRAARSSHGFTISIEWLMASPGIASLKPITKKPWHFPTLNVHGATDTARPMKDEIRPLNTIVSSTLMLQCPDTTQTVSLEEVDFPPSPRPLYTNVSSKGSLQHGDIVDLELF